MYQEVINAKTKRILETIDKIKEIENFYLAGGTALALQLGHRKSIDLDWFSQKEFDVGILKKDLSSFGSLKIDSEDKQTLNCRLDDVKISFFVYSYKILFPLIDFNKIKLADERDIACMKIDTIPSRGAKKDFIDLYFLLEKYHLEELLNLFDKKYAGIEYNRFHLLKSLTYFDDAESEPMPEMLKEISWEEIKNEVREKVKTLIK
jgi:hypothetical protein